MVHVIGGRSFIANARFQKQRACPSDICDGRNVTRAVYFFLRGFGPLPLNITPLLLHTVLASYC
jgi:hypothetical protein